MSDAYLLTEKFPFKIECDFEKEVLNLFFKEEGKRIKVSYIDIKMAVNGQQEKINAKRLSSLEKSVRQLEDENASLSRKNDNLERRNTKLYEENRTLLNNQAIYQVRAEDQYQRIMLLEEQLGHKQTGAEQ